MGKKKSSFYNIGLVMIVKNESHVVTESLESISPFIDYYVISDTGSTDNTVEIIQNFFTQKQIPGKIFYDTWIDFGTNRSKVLEHARPFLQFAWMLDADDLVQPSDPSFTKKDLLKELQIQNDGYQVSITEDDNKNFCYWRTQIFNLSKRWIYKGVLHEYPCIDGKIINDKLIKRLDNWSVISRRLGARNLKGIIEKYQKDAEILLGAVQSDPLNTRNIFYLANSYRDCQEYKKAIYWYEKRVDFGGWYEEVYFSLYMIGRIYLLILKDEKNGIHYCLKSYNAAKHRAESMNCIVYHYLLEKKYSIALKYLEKIWQLTLPEKDGLFIESMLYNGKLKTDYQLLLFLNFMYDKMDMRYLSDKVRTDIEILIKIPSMFLHHPSIRSLDLPSFLIPQNKEPVKKNVKNYRVFNPSVARDSQSNIWYNIRCSNFDDNYASCDSDGLVNTENYITDGEHYYKLIDRSKFYDRYRKNTKAHVLGYEDIRLFYYNHHWCFFANNDEISGYIDKPQVVFGRLAKQPISDSEWEIEYVVHLRFPFQEKIEKNWVPLLYPDGNFGIVYSTKPLKILEPDFVTGICSIKLEFDWHIPLTDFPFAQMPFRNSTHYIPFQEGWLTLCHIVYFLEPMNNQRLYYHLFVYFSKDFSDVKISKTFHFEDRVVEFANGLLDLPDSDEILITYSLADSIPKSIRLTTKEVLDFF